MVFDGLAHAVMKCVNEEFHFRAYTSLRRLPGRFSAEVCFVKGRDAIVNLWLVCEEVLQAQAAVELIEVGRELELVQGRRRWAKR